MKCYDCGAVMRQEAFCTAERAEELGASVEQILLWPLGMNPQGEMWVCCPRGHRAAWVMPTKPQSVLDVALQGVDDPLVVVASILSDIHEYLESRDDCWDENIDKATDALYTAMRRVQCQQEEIEDAQGYDDNTEHKRADDKERAASMQVHTR